MSELEETEKTEKYVAMTDKATEMLENIHVARKREMMGEKITEMVSKATAMLQISNTNGEPDDNRAGERAVMAVHDSRFMAQATNVVKACAEAVDVNATTYEAELLFENIVSLMKDSPFFEATGIFDWDKLYKETQICGTWVPSYDYMLGTFDDKDIVPKQRKVTERLAKQTKEAKRPEIVNASDKTEEGVEESVQDIMKQLYRAYRANGKRPVCFFTFVVDPESFGNTVENIFHLSFLVKDGYVQLAFDANGLPALKPFMKKSQERQEEDSGDDGGQMIISLDMEEYLDVIKTFGIKTAMIKRQQTVAASQLETTRPSTSRR